MNPQLVIAKCADGELRNDNSLEDTACFPFSPPVEMKGIWRVSLENSSFYPTSGGDGVWLEVRDPPVKAQASMQGDAPREFAVELVGRRSLCPVGYGHMGMTPHEVVVDRFISLREVAPPRT